MAKNAVADWDPVADNNSDIAGINISEGCPAASVNNAERTIMAQIAVWITAVTGPLLKTGGAVTGAITGMLTGSTVLDGAGTPRFLGYRGIPVKSITTAYTLTLADVGFCLEIGTGGSISIPLQATVAFAAGDAILFQEAVNATKTITPISGVSLIWTPTAGTGARTLAANGQSMLRYSATLNKWWISGDLT